MSDIEAWQPMVERVAKRVAREFPQNVEEDDLIQDLYLYILSGKLDPSDSWAEYRLQAKAKESAWGYKKASTYVSPEYAYTTANVIKTLDLIFSDTDGALPPPDAASLGNDWATDSGLKYAYDNIGPAYQQHIYDRYALGIFPESDSGRQQLYRAIVRMTDLLNMYRPRTDNEGPGARRVISNANAQSTITRQWEE